MLLRVVTEKNVAADPIKPLGLADAPICVL
jgi:hypothetical protein